MWSVDELTKQEEEEEEEEEEKSKKKKARIGTVYFTHMGSRSHITDRHEIWQFFLSDQRYHLLKIWY